MKRPLALIGFAFLSALFAASFLNVTTVAALAVLFALSAAVDLFCLKFWKFRKEAAAMLLAASVAAGFYSAVYAFRYQPAAALAGSQAELTGTISELPAQSYGNTYYVISPKTVFAGGKRVEVHSKIRLKTAEVLQAKPFDTITAKVTLSLPPQAKGGGFDSRSYYRSKGIYLFAKPLSGITVQAEKKRPPYYYAILLRQSISKTLSTCVRRDWGALSAGILIGDVSALPAGVKSDFSATGISHILAVSGTQTSLIAEYLLLLLCALRLPRRPAAACSAAAVFLFMAVTGFSPSVSRAGVMSMLYLGGLLLRREPDALNSLGLSVLLLCLLNPFAATDVGLLLSFAATLGMITVSKGVGVRLRACLNPLPAGLRKVLNPPAALLSETIGASLFTYPVIMLSFGQISLVTLVSNLLEVPVSLFVTLASALVVLLAPFRIFLFLIRPLALLIRIAAAFMMWYAHILAELPFATVSTSYGFMTIMLLAVLSIGLLYLLYRGRGASLRLAAASMAFLLVVGIGTYSAAAKGVLTVTSLPVSNGGCAVLYKDGGAVIFDLSGTDAGYQAVAYLKSRGVRRIDALILPAYNKSRVQQANDLLEQVSASDILIPGTYKSDENPSATCVGQLSVLSWRGTLLTLIPDRSGEALIAKVSYGGSTILLTGSNTADLSDYPADSSGLSSGLLVFGGGLNENFAKAVSPALAVEEDAGESSYGAAVLKTLGCTVHDTEENGRISVMTRGNGSYLVNR